MATQTSIQTFVHNLEEGGWAKWIRRAVVVVAVIYVVHLWMFRDSGFRGLNHERAIEQAQISREVARGNGFSTKMIRPAALWQFRENTGAFPLNNTPDTYHAPLHPWINSWFIRLPGVKKTWEMDPKDLVYLSDKVIAAVQVTFFLLAVLVSYFTAWRLFDQRLASYAAIAMLLCERFWDFSMSGLPQMLMLFLFSVAIYLMVRAVEARTEARSTLWWAIGTGVCFGLLALTHALTLWIFAGALLFALFYFMPRGRDAAIMVGIVALMYAPWMYRNEQVCGNPLGLGWYSGLFQIQGSESKVMRSMDLRFEDVSPTVFRVKLQGQTIDQLANLYAYLGSVLVAPVFFVALLHLFKRRETGVFRWCLFSMWIFAVLGMSAFGLNNEAVGGGAASTLHSNDLHVLFIPLLTSYGFAYILMLWSRLDISMRLARIAFLGVIFFVSSLPFIQQFIELEKPATGRVQWPPYVPPLISALSKWTPNARSSLRICLGPSPGMRIAKASGCP